MSEPPIKSEPPSMTEPPKRTGNVGCLGRFSIFVVLIVLTLRGVIS